MKGSVLERFEARTTPEPISGCLLWLASSNRGGYGQIKVGKQMKLAHRVSFELFRGPIGKLKVLHKCDTPACVNPQHLYLGTQLQNVKDRVERGRGNSGIRNKEKILCKNGHNEWARYGDGKQRKCRACAREAMRRKSKGFKFS